MLTSPDGLHISSCETQACLAFLPRPALRCGLSRVWSRTDAKYNESPVFGLAGIVLPSRERARILRILEERPDISGRALRHALAAEGAVFSASSVQRFLARHGLDRRTRLAWRRAAVQHFLKHHNL